MKCTADSGLFGGSGGAGGSRLTLSFLVLLVFSACANGQDATELLRQTAETYRTLEAYHIEGTVTVETTTGAGDQSFEMAVVMAERPEDYLRAEVRGPTMEVLVVSNEDGAWMYMPSENQYTRTESRNRADLGVFAQDLLGEYEQLAENVRAAQVLGMESVTVGGADREAIVLEVEYEAVASVAGADSTRKRLWIDAVHHLVLRDETSAYISDTPFGEPLRVRETTSFTRVETEAPPVSFFAFEPPANASFVDPAEIQGARAVIAAGNPAPAFSLPTLEGTELALRDLVGNVVLVNFWATWCGPCRMEMPELERLYQQYGEEGLQVLAVNVGETPDQVRPYVEQLGLTFPILLDASYAIGDVYQANSLPTTIVVDREGRIASLLLGAHPEEAFLRAARAAGL